MAWQRHPDMHVRLQNPNEARIFLDDPWTFYPDRKPKKVLLDASEVDISNTQTLNDELAIEIAIKVLEKVVIARAMLEDPPFPRHLQ
jgi:hypothetical protein